jgi:hypothetical protein
MIAGTCAGFIYSAGVVFVRVNPSLVLEFVSSNSQIHWKLFKDPCHRRFNLLFVSVMVTFACTGAVLLAFIARMVTATAVCSSDDWRDICNGRLISSEGGYQDQPQVVVRDDGGFACVLTLNTKRGE